MLPDQRYFVEAYVRWTEEVWRSSLELLLEREKPRHQLIAVNGDNVLFPFWLLRNGLESKWDSDDKNNFFVM